MRKTLLTILIVVITTFFVNAQTTFSTKIPINTSTGANPYVIDSGELSGDTFNDIVIGTFANTIEFYKNNGDGTFTLQPLVSSTLSGPTGVHIADLNNDTYNDILAAGYNSNKLVWFANDGSGNFGPEQVISSSISGAGIMVTGTIDAGSTIDVAIVAYGSGETVWFSNDGSGSFTGPNTIASVPASGPGDLDLGDFDGDGDLDAVIANTDSGTIELYDNNLIPSGTVSFTKYTNSVDTGNVYLFDVAFADVNDDLILDIITADVGAPGKVAYFTKDALGTSTTFTETVISTGVSIARPATATVADFDNDTKNDVLSTNAGTAGSDVEWFESTDIGTFNTVAPIDNSQNIVYATTVNDFDNDGDLDIATIDYQNSDLNWFENELITLSSTEFETVQINIYPNPTKNKLHFRGLIDQSYSISIYDILGKNILNTTLGNDKTLNVSHLNSGVYILKIIDFNYTFKFVKE